MAEALALVVPAVEVVAGVALLLAMDIVVEARVVLLKGTSPDVVEARVVLLKGTSPDVVEDFDTGMVVEEIIPLLAEVVVTTITGAVVRSVNGIADEALDEEDTVTTGNIVVLVVGSRPLTMGRVEAPDTTPAASQVALAHALQV